VISVFAETSERVAHDDDSLVMASTARNVSMTARLHRTGRDERDVDVGLRDRGGRDVPDGGVVLAVDLPADEEQRRVAAGDRVLGAPGR
jgi:hypothetical protein